MKMIFEILTATGDDDLVTVLIDVNTFNTIMKQIVVQAWRTPYTEEEDE